MTYVHDKSYWAPSPICPSCGVDMSEPPDEVQSEYDQLWGGCHGFAKCGACGCEYKWTVSVSYTYNTEPTGEATPKPAADVRPGVKLGDRLMVRGGAGGCPSFYPAVVKRIDEALGGFAVTFPGGESADVWTPIRDENVNWYRGGTAPAAVDATKRW